jgi:multicomponent Na+:H+ antiporter subunit E
MRTALRMLAGVIIGMIWWLVLTQDTDGLSLAGAAALSLAAVAFAGPVIFEERLLGDTRGLLRLDLFVRYLLTVLLHSYIASAELIWRMLARRYDPGIVRIRTRLRSPLGRAILANSVSLIPGTLSLWMKDRYLYVHWFDARTSHTVKAGHLIMQRPERLLERVFG